MLKILQIYALIFACTIGLLVTYGQQSQGAFHGGGIVYLTPGTGWPGATANPGQIGSNTDDAIAGWDMVPFQTLVGTFQVCVQAYHNQGINYVAVAADGGSWVNVGVLTTNSASGAPEYCVSAQASSFADGQHEFRAIVYPNAGVPRVLSDSQIATISIGNPAVVTQIAHGLWNYTTVAFEVSAGGALPVAITAGTCYYLANATTGGVTQSSYQISTTQGGAAISTLGDTQSGIITVTPCSLPGLASMWVNTNANGTLNAGIAARYVDPAGSDSNPCTGNATPSTQSCLTINGAIVSMIPTGNTDSFSVSNATPAVFSRGSSTFVNGMAVILGAGSVPGGFTEGRLYWVVNAGAGGAGAGKFELATAPNGSPIGSSSAGTVNVYLDFGGATVYADIGAYAYGPGSEPSLPRYGDYQWVNIQPAPGVGGPALFTASIDGSNVLHVTAVLSGTLAVNDLVNGPGLTAGTVTIASEGTGTGGVGTYNLSGSPGAMASEDMTAGGVFITSNGNAHGLRITKAHLKNVVVCGGNCPNVSTGVSFTLAQTDGPVWLDSSVGYGDGAITDAHTTAAFSGFLSNDWITQYVIGTQNNSLAYRTTVYNVDAVAFSGSQILVNDTAYNIGIDYTFSITSSGDTPLGSTSIVYASLPAAFTQAAINVVPWTIGASKCLPSGGTSATTSTVSGDTIGITAATTCDIPDGTVMSLTSSFHPDVEFTYEGGDNQIQYNLQAYSTIIAENYFRQNAAYYDQAIIGSDLGAAGNFDSMLIENLTMSNFFVANSTFGQRTIFEGSWTFNDTYWSNDTCLGGTINSLYPSNGINFINSPASNPC